MRIRWLLAQLLWPLLLAQTPDSQPIRTATRLVLLNVVATNKHGNAVDDLQRGDFTLRDNGQEQKIAFFVFPNQAPPAPPHFCLMS